MSLENNVFYFLNIMVIFLFVFGDSRVDMYFNLVFDGLLIVFSVLVVVINLLVILLFFYREYLQIKINSLFISLVVFDFMVGVLGILLNIVCNVFLEEGVCIVVVFIYRFIVVFIMYYIFVVILERYIYVMYLMKYINIVIGFWLFMVIVGFWFLLIFFLFI